MSKNKEILRQHAEDILKGSYEAMLKKIDKAINSGALDVDNYDPNHNPMVLPKIIVKALLEDEATQYDAKGTSFERQIKKEVKNLRYFI